MLRIRTFIVMVCFLGPMTARLGGFHVFIFPSVCPAFVGDLRRSRTDSQGWNRKAGKSEDFPAATFQLRLSQRKRRPEASLCINALPMKSIAFNFLSCVCLRVCLCVCVCTCLCVCVCACVHTREGVLNSVSETDT